MMDTNTLTSQETHRAEPFSFLKIKTPWLVVLSASLFFFYELLQIHLFNALNPDLMRTFHISGVKLGQLSAAYFYANVLFIFVAGVLIDLFSVRKIIELGMLSLVVCTFLFSLSTSIWQIICLRFLMGIAGSFTLTSIVKLASRWFSSDKMASVVGLCIAFSMLGSVISQTPITILTDSLGWRKTLGLDACIGIALWFIIVKFVSDNPENTFSPQTNIHTQKNNQVYKMIIRAAKNPQNWLGGTYALFMNVPILVLGAMWGSLYLTQVRHLERTNSTLITSMIFIGTIIGAPVMGWISDKMKSRKIPMIFNAIISLLLILEIIFAAKLNFTSLLCLFLSLGFFTSAQVLTYPLISEHNPSYLIASAEGLAQTLIMAGGLLQPLFGYLMELNWKHIMIDGLPIYTPSDFRLALMIVPVGFVIALFSICFIQEKPS